MAGVSAGAGFDFDAYSSFVYVADLDVLEQAAISLIEMYEADGTPNLANLIRQGYTRFLRELEGISRDIAKFAQKRIVEIEQDTRVRPDTEGDGGERMEDYLGHSDPIPGLEGAVGINDERPLKQNVPWWWTNEEGYSGHIGREITGYFFDAGWDNPTAPDPGFMRHPAGGEHPLFMPGKTAAALYGDLGFSGGGMGPRGGKGRRMTIGRPIPARHFFDKGYEEAAAKWHDMVRAAKARLSAELDRVAKLQAVQLP
jgi:hypothetical protein